MNQQTNQKKQCQKLFVGEKLATRVIMDCKVRRHFEKELLVLTKIMSSFEGENMQTQYNVLGYKIDFYFHDYKLAIEIDENGHSERNIDYKIKGQKAM